MSKKQTLKPIAIVVGTAFAAGMAMSNVASAATSSNPFAMQEMSHGYMQVADAKEGSCGSKKQKEIQEKMKEGNCGGTKKNMSEGNCGASKDKKPEPKKAKEGSCGGKK